MPEGAVAIARRPEPVEWAAVRAEFPALATTTYLNTATFGQLPRAAVEAMQRHLLRRDERACADFLAWFDDADRVRGLAAQLVGCQAEDIAFLPSASAALAILLQGIDWRPGDRVVTFEGEFPNQLYGPALLRERHVEFAAVPWDGLEAALTPRTRLVVASTMNYSTGFCPPLEELSRRLHERGILLYLDGTQGAGAVPLDVSAVRPVMLAVHGYKWLLSPNGLAFVYVAPETREWLAPGVIGWRSHHDWRNVDQLHQGAPTLPEGAERYEGGMLPTLLIEAMGASLELLLSLGMDRIHARVRELAERCRVELRALGAVLLSDEKPHHDGPIIAARWPGVDASRLARELAARGVLVSARHGHLRVSVHLYNDRGDLARLTAALRGMLPTQVGR